MKRSEAPLSDRVTDTIKSAGLPKVSLLVTDLDNTLWDWFEIWYRSFSALLDGIVRISGIPKDVLYGEIREIHQRRGTSEYSFLIGEMPSLQKLHSGADLQEVYRDAFEASRSARHEVLELYPEVSKTLRAIKKAGTKIAAYTESLAFVTAARVKYLGLDGVLDVLYSPPDHDFPHGVSAEDLRRFEPNDYGLKHTEHRHTPRGLLKPAPEVLRQIIAEMDDSQGVVYVGDSLMKDIAMAQAVGAIDVWAEYGDSQDRPEYKLLQDVSHWTDADVKREAEIRKRPHVAPSVTLQRSFGELFDHFEFVKNGRR